MAGPLSRVHDHGVSTSIGHPSVNSVLYILPKLGPSRHLHEVMCVKSNVGVFDHDGILGAKLFYCIENISNFWDQFLLKT